MYDGGKGGVGGADDGTISTKGIFTFFTRIWYKHWTCISQLDFVVKFLDLNCIFLQDNVQESYWVDGYVQIIHVNNWTGSGRGAQNGSVRAASSVYDGLFQSIRITFEDVSRSFSYSQNGKRWVCRAFEASELNMGRFNISFRFKLFKLNSTSSNINSAMRGNICTRFGLAF